MSNDPQQVQILMCNTRPSPVDNRDWVAEMIYDNSFKLPFVLDLRDKLPPIRVQGALSTCAAHSGSCIKDWQTPKQPHSPFFIYNNREDQTVDGMFGRDVMSVLKNIGSLDESVYTSHIEPAYEIESHLYEQAKTARIKGYARIYTIDILKRALLINGPCYISFPVFNASTRMWKPKPGQRQKGGHAMTVVGYDSNGFLIRNCWGDTWGKGGYCIYPYSDWGSHYEIWSRIDEHSSSPLWIDRDEDQYWNVLYHSLTSCLSKPPTYSLL